MKDEKNGMYSVSWKQPYQTYSMKPLQEAMDEVVENIIDNSDMKEAKQVLSQIMSKK